MDTKEHYQVSSISFFDKKTGSGKSANGHLAKELHKPGKKKSKEENYVRDLRTILDLAEMESLSSKNKNVKYLLCVINIFNKYVWVKIFKR